MGVILFVIIVPFLISFIVAYVFGTAKLDDQAKKAIINLIYLIVSVITAGMSSYAYLKGLRGEKITIANAFDVAIKKSIKVCLTTALVGIIGICSLSFFIIPFFFIAPKLSLAILFVVDEDLGPIEAIRASWSATNGNFWKIWGIIGVQILFGLACIVLIGIYFGIMYSAAFAALYLFATGDPSLERNSIKENS